MFRVCYLLEDGSTIPLVGDERYETATQATVERNHRARQKSFIRYAVQDVESGMLWYDDYLVGPAMFAKCTQDETN